MFIRNKNPIGELDAPVRPASALELRQGGVSKRSFRTASESCGKFIIKQKDDDIIQFHL